jgi:hypothetical protein
MPAFNSLMAFFGPLVAVTLNCLPRGDHAHNPNVDLATHMRRCIHQDQHVQRIAVLAQRGRHKAESERKQHAFGQQAAELEQPGLRIVRELVPRSFRRVASSSRYARLEYRPAAHARPRSRYRRVAPWYVHRCQVRARSQQHNRVTPVRSLRIPDQPQTRRKRAMARVVSTTLRRFTDELTQQTTRVGGDGSRLPVLKMAEEPNQDNEWDGHA